MLRSKYRKYLAGIAVGALTIGLAACSGGGGRGGGVDADGNATVVWSTWGTADELTRFEEFNKDFMDRHPDIKVKLQPVAGYGDYHSKLLAQLTSNTAPDVFYIGDDMIGQFVDSGRLMPLKDLMDSKDSKTKHDDFFPGLFGAAEKDDEVYAAPNDSNPDVLWYDKEALKAAGVTEDPATLAENGQWTTDKYLEMNAKLHDAKLTGSMFWNYWATHWSWLSSQGIDAPYDDSGAFVADEDADAVEAMQQLGDLFQDGTFVVADTLPDGAGADSVFVTHKAADRGADHLHVHQPVELVHLAAAHAQHRGQLHDPRGAEHHDRAQSGGILRADARLPARDAAAVHPVPGIPEAVRRGTSRRGGQGLTPGAPPPPRMRRELGWSRQAVK